jgi:tyrosinase
MSNGLVARKNVEHLGPSELAALRSAYAKMQAIVDNRGFNYLAGLHGIPSLYCVHYDRPPLFLPWHRAYLLEFEANLRAQDSTVAIPWWDWTSAGSHTSGVPSAFAPPAVNGQPNPLYKSHMNIVSSNPPQDRDTQRFPMAPNLLPQPIVLKTLLNKPDFQDFSLSLRTGVHNQIHGWTGGQSTQAGHLVPGDMGMVPFAAYDPIFFSHHCMIDRMWYLWQVKFGTNNVPANILATPLKPFQFTVADVLDIEKRGYQYVTDSATIPS